MITFLHGKLLEALPTQVVVEVNHTGWTVRQLFDREDVIERIRAAASDRTRHPSDSPRSERLLRLAATMGSLPSPYLDYYYFREETLAEARAKPTTRAQDILAESPGYWRHYEEQSRASDPVLDPARSRGGILELELAIDVIDAIVNDRRTVWPVNVPLHCTG